MWLWVSLLEFRSIFLHCRGSDQQQHIHPHSSTSPPAARWKTTPQKLFSGTDLGHTYVFGHTRRQGSVPTTWLRAAARRQAHGQRLHAPFYILWWIKRGQALTPKHRHNCRQDSTNVQSIPSLLSVIASHNLDRFLHSQPGTSRIKLQVSLYDTIPYLFLFTHLALLAQRYLLLLLLWLHFHPVAHPSKLFIKHALSSSMWQEPCWHRKPQNEWDIVFGEGFAARCVRHTHKKSFINVGMHRYAWAA